MLTQDEYQTMAFCISHCCSLHFISFDFKYAKIGPKVQPRSLVLTVTKSRRKTIVSWIWLATTLTYFIFTCSRLPESFRTLSFQRQDITRMVFHCLFMVCRFGAVYM